MARLEAITRKDQLAAKDHAVYDSIVASRGAVHGPFAMFLHSPDIAGRVAHVGAYVRFEGSLDILQDLLGLKVGTLSPDDFSSCVGCSRAGNVDPGPHANCSRIADNGFPGRAGIEVDSLCHLCRPS